MSSESTEQHRQESDDLQVAVAILTISDTRTEEDDRSGQLIRSLLEEHGHFIAAYGILKDNPERIASDVQQLSEIENIDVIITNGGTGVAPRDGTIEAVTPLIDREIPGFGELFRMLSWEEVGSASMLSRAVAGLIGNKLLICMPGSPNAVSLGMNRLVLPEMKHIIWEIRGREI